MTNQPVAVFDGKLFASQLSTAPGVYRMFAADDTLLYVGKAAALRKRVASYFNATPKNGRLTKMLSQVASMDVTVTRNEAEALLLENQLIKSLHPKYNILLRDDKSYAHVLITKQQWPRVTMHRGTKSVAGRYFGPYPSAHAVRETLNMMHKLFKLRSCEDSIFSHRSRPCLQYQIARCSAPCVGKISEDDYAQTVHQAMLLLDGKNDQLANELMDAMHVASQDLAFETAARIRDVLSALRTIQSRQYVDGQSVNLDVLACEIAYGQACVLLLSFRNGCNLGTRAFFPTIHGEDCPEEVLSAFISQYYAEFLPPTEIIVDRPIPDQTLLQNALSDAAERKVSVRWSVRGERAGYLAFAVRNAKESLHTALHSQHAQQARCEALKALLGIDREICRVECFDISHTFGEATIASCVVFDANGPITSQYRRYNINAITPGDDYSAMHQALMRRFKRALETQGPLPDVLLIDGGVGQRKQAMQVLNDLGIKEICVIGVAKGEERRAGAETLLLPGGRTIQPGAHSPALQFIQQVRDEAHRFAITGHRQRRQKTRSTSTLEDIPGVGPRRRASMLRHFGGLTGLKAASKEDIARVKGINDALAMRIYATLHGLPHTDLARTE